MINKKRLPIVLIVLSILTISSKNNSNYYQKVLKDSVYVKNDVFEVVYSEILEQPKVLTYYSTNRPYNFNRNGMDFYLVDGIHTSGSNDYKWNIWDKGHLAPAASFSDTKKNLTTTFSYLNCALQHKELNRTEWKMLEEQERIWDNTDSLKITVILEFEPRVVLKSDASIPSAFHKHIYWISSGEKRCYFFPNKKPTKPWNKYLKKNCPILK